MERKPKKSFWTVQQWKKVSSPVSYTHLEIYPDSPWNYSLVLDKKEPLKNFKVIRKSWPADNYPFTVASVPSVSYTHLLVCILGNGILSGMSGYG